MDARIGLQVGVLHERDVPGAVEGGADRLLLATEDGLSPDLGAVSSVLREADVPVRVVLRLNDSHTTTGGEFARLVGLGHEFAALGAEGLVFGFLDRDLEVDVTTCRALADGLPGAPWTFSTALDACLEPARAWRRVAGLPGLDGVMSAGSPRGAAVGYDDLLALVRSDEQAAALLVACGGVVPEQVPWLARAGTRWFHVADQVRPGASYRAYVDPGHVRAWRMLLDS